VATKAKEGHPMAVERETWVERLAVVLFCLAGLGGVSIWYGVKELHTTARSSATPEPIALVDLIARGSEGNPYVQITGFRIGDQHATLRSKNDVIGGDAYVPLMPRDGDPGQVAIYKTGALSAQFFMSEKPLEGMVSGTGVPTKVHELLARRYPLLNFDNVLVIESGHPEPASYGWTFVGLGVALILPFPLALYVAHRRDKRQRQEARIAYEAGELPAFGYAAKPSQEPDGIACDDNEAVRQALAAERRQAWDEALAQWGKLAQSSNSAITAMAQEHLTMLQERTNG
jgi:hypothetical protein